MTRIKPVRSFHRRHVTREGFAFDSSGRLFVTQQGRDQLHANWPKLYKPGEEATLPAEELLLLKPGGDYGWPECYYDGVQQKLVLAPEYGGDGGKKVGLCGDKIAPVASLPAHWAPNAMVRYDQTRFPARYRSGVFIAFHGSWDRAPYTQSGYNVVFQPVQGDRAPGNCEVFADGFAGNDESPGGAAHRPSGLAVGPDGSLYVSDDIHGRIYRIAYKGGVVSDRPRITPCRVRPLQSMKQWKLRPNRRRERIQTLVRLQPASSPFTRERHRRWLPSAIASTTGK
jgi:glucose/arabinose dehydrogenase